jgi:hypothetical protein
MDKLFRKFKKVSNPPKPIHYEPIIKEIVEGNKKLEITFQPFDDKFKGGYYIGRTYVNFKVFLGDKLKFTKLINDISLDTVNKLNDDFLELEIVKGYLESIKKNILPLIDSPDLWKNYQDFGTANGWKETPQYIKDCEEIRKNTPYFVEFVEGEQIGRCWSRTINHTFKYKYDVDSSD